MSLTNDSRPAPGGQMPMRAAAAATLLLLALYWLTASGAFHSIDEHAVFAVGRNLAYHGRIDQSSLYWEPPYDAHAKVGAGHELYSKYGIGHSLLVAIPVTLARLIPGAGLVTTSMLLDMLATALTGGLLVLLAARLGYSVRTGIAAGLLYGAASFAWVYARTLFSEPLVALVWLLAVYVLLPLRTPRRAFLAGLCLAASIAIRPAMTVVMPFFLGLLWVRPSSRDDWLRLLTRLIAFGAPLALTAAGLLAFNAYRFGNPFDFGYTETFNGSLVAGLLGFTFSLDRSLFLFAPPLVALLWSLPRFVRQYGVLAWQILAIPLATLLLYSLWPVFWGGPVWGPRYLLPVLPVIFVFLLPTIQQAIEKAGWQRITLIVLAALGVVMQLRGVIWNSLPLTQTLGQRYPLWLLPPQQDQLDIVWAVYRPAGAAVAAAMLALAAVALWRPARRWLALAGVAALAGSVVLLSWLGGSPLGYVAKPAYASALSQLEQAGRAGDALILNPAPYQDPIAEIVWFLNSPRALVPFYGVLRLPADVSGVGGTRTTSENRAIDLLGKYKRLWLLTEGVSPGDPQSTTENFLTSSAAEGGTAWLEDGFRLSRFDAILAARAGGTPQAVFGNDLLVTWAAAWAKEKPDSVQVRVMWRQLQPSPEDLHAFIQVLNSAGQAIAAWDGAIPRSAVGASPQSEPRTVFHHVALALPQTQPGEELRIIAGLYRAATGERLRLPDGSDALELTRLP